MDEQACRKEFEAFYLNDAKAGSDCPIPWGHSWIESRWRFWRAAWQAAAQYHGFSVPSAAVPLVAAPSTEGAEAATVGADSSHSAGADPK